MEAGSESLSTTMLLSSGSGVTSAVGVGVTRGVGVGTGVGVGLFWGHQSA